MYIYIFSSVVLSERASFEKLSHLFDICAAYQLSPVATHLKDAFAIKAAVTATSASHLLHHSDASAINLVQCNYVGFTLVNSIYTSTVVNEEPYDFFGSYISRASTIVRVAS